VIERTRLLDTFLELVRIDSPSGCEEAIARALVERLQELGLDVTVDAAGNVLGRRDGDRTPLLLNAHMDTVPGRGIQPVVEEGVIRSDRTTILGADDKSGLAIILEVLSVVRARGGGPGIEVALSVGEEVGLLGAKAMDRSWFRATSALVLDSGGPLNAVVHAAPASDKLRAVVHGRAAHAGANPEDGINAIWVAAQAIAAMPLGRIDDETTANVGTIEGGQAVNVVPDRVEIRGEARSHDPGKLNAQVTAMRGALEGAVAAHPGASLDLRIERTYQAFRLAPDAPIIRRVAAGLSACGAGPIELKVSGGGSDANILNARGICAVPISTGMQAVHTTDEFIALDDMVRCAELVLRVLDGWGKP